MKTGWEPSNRRCVVSVSRALTSVFADSWEQLSFAMDDRDVSRREAVFLRVFRTQHQHGIRILEV
jgi:hypothetical protein